MTDIQIIQENIVDLKIKIGEDYLLSSQNGAELISDSTPISFDIFQQLNSYEGSLGIAYRNLGLELKPFDQSQYAIYFMGRTFLNLKAEQSFIHRNLGYEYVVKKDDIALVPVKKNLKNIIKLTSYSYHQAYLISRIDKYLISLKEHTEKLASIPDLTLNNQSNHVELFKDELKLFINEYSSIFESAFLEQIIFQFTCQKYTKSKVHNHLARLKYSQDLPDYYFISSIELQNCLGKNGNIDEFIKKYGQRSFDDFEISSPRFKEIKDELVNLSNISRSGASDKYHPTDYHSAPTLIKKLQAIIVTKNNLRLNILKRYYRIRQILLALDEKYSLNNNIFYLKLDEVLSIASIDNIHQYIDQRKEIIDNLKKIPLPSIILPTTEFSDLYESHDKVINFNPVSPGKAIGRLAFINSPLEDLDYGKIAVFPNANPDFTHLYNKARAIIFLKGGELSHGSVIAREMNIPAGIFHNISILKKLDSKDILFNADEGIMEITKT